jgi:ATP-dependent Clp protease ATP-binding subunit ClpC
MTSNIGARFIQKKASLGFQTSEANDQKGVQEMVLGEVKRTFNPEFINRVDELIVFDALNDDELRKILALLVDQLNINLLDRRMKVIVVAEVADWIIDITCKDRSYGARPLRRPSSAISRTPSPRSSFAGTCRGGDRGLPRRRAAGLSSGRPAGGRRPPLDLERLNLR